MACRAVRFSATALEGRDVCRCGDCCAGGMAWLISGYHRGHVLILDVAMPRQKICTVKQYGPAC